MPWALERGRLSPPRGLFGRTALLAVLGACSGPIGSAYAQTLPGRPVATGVLQPSERRAPVILDNALAPSL